MGQLAEAVSRLDPEGRQEPPALCPVPDRDRQGDGRCRCPADPRPAAAQDRPRARRGHGPPRPRLQADLLRRRRQDQPGRPRRAQAGDRHVSRAVRARPRPKQLARRQSAGAPHPRPSAGPADGAGPAAAEVAQAVVAGASCASLPNSRDEWYLPTLAEASLGLGDWDEVERCIRALRGGRERQGVPGRQHAAPVHRVWDLEHADDRGPRAGRHPAGTAG